MFLTRQLAISLAVGNIMTISLEDCIGRAEPQTT